MNVWTQQGLCSIFGGPIRVPALGRAVPEAVGGGPGLRRVREMQHPAFLASRADCRPLAESIAETLPSELRADIFGLWDVGVAGALSAWKNEVPECVGGTIDQLLAEADGQARQKAWHMMGHLPNPVVGVPECTRERTEASLLQPLGSQDPEFPGSEFAGLRARLCGIGSAARIQAVVEEYKKEEDWPSVLQLQDLQDPGTDHTWLWLLAGADAPPFTASEFCTAVRLRIGADVVPDGQPCSCCGEAFRPRGLHALVCAPGESTRGHYAVSGVVHCLASLSDSSASTEARGLVPSRPALRPADILTSAAFGRQAALDVCVACPHSGGAGPDACVAAIQRKRAKYADILCELQREGYDYKPLVRSCWGRPDADASLALRTMVSAVARRKGFIGAAQIEKRARALIGAHIWRRAARMVLACLRCCSAEDVAELLPTDADDSCSVGDSSAAAGEDGLGHAG